MTTIEQDGIWRTSVTELILLFAEALSSIVPPLRRARIVTTSVGGADAWDDISETLFEHIVVEAIRSALPEQEMEALQIPRYQMDYDSYRGFDVIEVENGSSPEEGKDRLVFHHLEIAATTTERVDKVFARRINRAREIQSMRLHELPLETVTFCCVRRDAGQPRILTDLEVVL